jgi:ELWxxDGT repeat protein
LVGERLFYLAETAGTGQELWISDGTVEGTHLVKDIVPGQVGCGIAAMVAAGDTLFFAAFGEDGNPGLWKSDGTEQGTVLVKAGSLVPFDAVGETVLLLGSEPETGREFWKSDGTAEGTVQVLDLHAGRDNDADNNIFKASLAAVLDRSASAASRRKMLAPGPSV